MNSANAKSLKVGASVALVALMLSTLTYYHFQLPTAAPSIWIRAAGGAWATYLLVAFLFGWQMIYGAVGSPSISEDPSDGNRISRWIGALVGLFMYTMAMFWGL